MEFDFGGQWNFITEFTQDWGNRFLEGTNKTCAHQDPGKKSSHLKRDRARLACEHPGVSGQGVGQQWPAAGSGALKTMVRPQVLLKEVTIIFFTSTIVWLQVKQQGGNTAPPINRKLD